MKRGSGGILYEIFLAPERNMLTLFLTPEWITVSDNENGFYLCECTDFAYRFPTPEEA